MMDGPHIYFLPEGRKTAMLTRFKWIVPDEVFHTVTVSVVGMDEVEKEPGCLSWGLIGEMETIAHQG